MGLTLAPITTDITLHTFPLPFHTTSGLARPQADALYYLCIKTKEMKKAKKVMGALALTVVAAAGIMWWVSSTSNPWNAKTVGDIDAPAGYTRVEGSYAEFMRRLPLKKRGSRVQLFTGGDAGYQFLSTGVIDLPMLSNWEQCADMTMRVRAEYLFCQGRYADIRFRDVNGNMLNYTGGNSRKALEMFLKKAYGVCSTLS